MIVPPALAYTDICPNFQTSGKWKIAANVAYLSLSRPAWTCGVALLVFMCMRGDGGVVNTILSWRPWDAMAKLTYGAYLIHPILIRVVLYNRMDLIDFSLQFFIVHFVFFLVASYAIAFVMFTLVETPFAGILGALTGKRT